MEDAAADIQSVSVCAGNRLLDPGIQALQQAEEQEGTGDLQQQQHGAAAFAPDSGQGLQDDPHQDLAAEMRLVVAGIAGPPGRGPQRDGVAQGAAPLVLQCRSDLLRQGEQRV